MPLPACAVVAFACLLGGSLAAAQGRDVPVTLDPPAGFTRSGHFPGYEKPESAASILISEMSAPLEQVRPTLSIDALAARGIRMLAAEELDVDGYQALLLHLSQTASGEDFEEWMLVLGEGDRSVMLLGTYPAELAGELRDAMKTSLLSVKWNRATRLALAPPSAPLILSTRLATR